VLEGAVGARGAIDAAHATLAEHPRDAVLADAPSDAAGRVLDPAHGRADHPLEAPVIARAGEQQLIELEPQRIVARAGRIEPGGAFCGIDVGGVLEQRL
jgi:hypothetical protein